MDLQPLGNWQQHGAKLTGGDEIGSGFFGESVALSADGNTALMGGSGDDDGAGAAWVFGRRRLTLPPASRPWRASGRRA